VFRQFKKAIFVYGGSILSFSQFFTAAPAASKNEVRFKSGKNQVKKISSLTAI
jgi:hypothetical protein